MKGNKNIMSIVKKKKKNLEHDEFIFHRNTKPLNIEKLK